MTTEDEILKVAPDPVRVGREAAADQWERTGFAAWAREARLGLADTQPAVYNAILGARAMQKALADREAHIAAERSSATGSTPAVKVKALISEWDEAYRAFVGAFDTPVERRRRGGPENKHRNLAPAPDDLVDRLDAPTPFYGWKDPENYTPVMIPPDPLRTEASARIRSDAATIASLRAEVEGLGAALDNTVTSYNVEANRAEAAEAERDALKAEVERKDAALREIAEAYTAHGYSDAMDAVQALKDIAKEALK